MINMKIFLAALFLLSALHAEKTPDPAIQKVATEMSTTANRLIQSLNPEQIQKTRFPFSDDERVNWHFIPKNRLGLPLSDLSPAQLDLVRSLLKSAMSEKGLLKIDTIISLEAFLGEIENRPAQRDPEKYYTSIFGDPTPHGTWGWRFEGHHLSLNFTLIEGTEISTTPSFLAANPAEVRAEHKLKGTRPLAAEEDLARTLATALHETGKSVIYTTQAPDDILTGADRVLRQLEPVGVPAKDFTQAQKDGLFKLISEYANRHRKELAEKDLAKIRADFANLSFGWAGSLKLGEAYYYRIQGSDFLIEAANVQNNANHIHTVWRNRANDFGRDVLGNHQEHHKKHGHDH